MNPAQIKKLQKLQKEMMQKQKEIEETVFIGKSGGVVEVKVKGSKEVLDISIDKEAVDGPEDLEMLQDTLLAALNDAMKQIDKANNETMGQLTSGFGGGMPGLF